jgi:hypothetical protein|mmetsp:Transcript_32459/g.100450  ORF Transcript_32459/g.100450 Transcript_32459/m.100450 type:complete len:138 (+) Transcript_32459:3407-3820(+)
MAERNTESLVRVYVKTELLFAKLVSVLEQHESWCVLCSVLEIDVLTEKTCESPSSYEINFKALRNLRLEADKLPDFIQVDCIRISLLPLKSSLEKHFQLVHDTLGSVIKRNITDDIKEVCVSLLQGDISVFCRLTRF